MVTVRDSKSVWGHAGNEENKWVVLFEFEGLTTDDFPSKEYDGYLVANGSTFHAIDGGAVYSFDSESGKWHRSGSGSSGGGSESGSGEDGGDITEEDITIDPADIDEIFRNADDDPPESGGGSEPEDLDGDVDDDF